MGVEHRRVPAAPVDSERQLPCVQAAALTVATLGLLLILTCLSQTIPAYPLPPQPSKPGPTRPWRVGGQHRRELEILYRFLKVEAGYKEVASRNISRPLLWGVICFGFGNSGCFLIYRHYAR